VKTISVIEEVTLNEEEKPFTRKEALKSGIFRIIVVTIMAIIASIYYQIKDDLEKIVEKANLEYSQNK
jgi:hypothetical protein